MKVVVQESGKKVVVRRGSTVVVKPQSKVVVRGVGVQGVKGDDGVDGIPGVDGADGANGVSVGSRNVFRTSGFPVWQQTPFDAATLGNVTETGFGTLRLWPIDILQTITFDQIAFRVAVAGATTSSIRLGIYADDGTFTAPKLTNGLLHDFGTVSNMATVGVRSVALGTPVTLTPGRYWFAGVMQGSGTFGTYTGFTRQQIAVSSAAAYTQTGYQMSSVSGALPSTLVLSTGASGQGFTVYLRLTAASPWPSEGGAGMEVFQQPTAPVTATSGDLWINTAFDPPILYVKE